MVRAPFYDQNGIKRGAWSSEEDDKLRAYVERYGYWNWRELPKYAGLSRCGKSCRLRWMNYLRPDVKRGNYAAEEETLIIKLHEEHGNKWSLIAANLPGRTDNEIKNHWHSHLKKRATHKTPTTTTCRSLREDHFCDESSHQCEQSCHSTNGEAEAESRNDHDEEETSPPPPPILESSQSPKDTIRTNISSGTSSVLVSHTSNTDYFSSHENNNYYFSPIEVFCQEYYSTGSDFWSKPFLEDDMSSQNDSHHPTCYVDGASSHDLSYYDDGMNMESFFYQI